MPPPAHTGRLRAFQSLGLLGALNVAAVGLSLASVTAAAFGRIFGEVALSFAFATAGPTLVLGTLWAALLRSPKTVGKTSFRWGWAASMPLAMLNGALSAGFAFGLGRSHAGSFAEMAFVGATLGAICWVPGLLVTLLCFGAPIASAQKLAKKGLAGVERGEWTVGLACAAMSAVALAMTGSRTFDQLSTEGSGLIVMLATLGGLLGATTTALAMTRELRRKRFVEEAEAGRVPGYRIEPTNEGKVLIRVEAQGKGYRVADFEEEVFELDADGTAMRPRQQQATT
jgi:hypothetical protein